MDSECGLVKIALKLKAGSLDELLVFGIVRDFRQLAGNVRAADPLQVDVKESVGTGQQAGRFGRGVFAQEDQRARQPRLPAERRR